jgi:hypothetical protein
MVLASSAADRGFEPRSGQANDYTIGICCFFVKHKALRRKSKDLLAMNRDNVSEFSDISTRGQLFQWASTICWSSTKTYWLWIRILCQSLVTFPPADSCFSQLALLCWSSTKTYWLWIRIICQSLVTFLPPDSCFSELALYVGLVQRLIGYESW